ncbi:hypothetical protein PSHT_06760 [Puccinia striiformis]|uniref:Uncharacterized protein n=1 Tax=Puccinia striiformis TaxID=27350 RepID=A0A2S4W410_9BASI|nr:hypothetical protein PSHT_06760 [Puccinia striiformis]
MEIVDRLTESVSLLAGNCRFKKNNEESNNNDTIESEREELINQSLELTTKIFNQSLKLESDHLTTLQALTNSSSSRSTKNQAIPLLPRTPLEELYLPTPSDPLAIWHQLSLRQNCLNNWVRQTIDLDVQADHRQQNAKQEQDQDQDQEDDILESDELSSLEDDSSFATEQLFSSSPSDSSSSDDDDDTDDENQLDPDRQLGPNESYLTPLNDADQESNSSQGSSEDEQNMMSIDTLESRPTSSTKISQKPKRRSAVDSEFFSLAEFEQEAEEGEAEMRRKLRRSTGQTGQPEDEDTDDEEEEVDLFAKFDTGLIDDDDDDDDAMDEDGEEGGQVDLDSVADLRYNDFFAPISKKPSGGKRQNKPVDTPLEPKDPSTKKVNLTSKIGKVKFSEQVKVKEIPAKNRGVRVAEMSSTDEDEDSDEDFFLDEISDSEQDISSGTNESDSDPDQNSDEDSDGGEKTMSRLSGELFDDGFSDQTDDSDDDDDLQSEDKDPKDLSKHAKKMKTLSKQIAILESENVAKKEWMMKGEAASKDRPQNSLLEQDLEFEHVQKLVPAVTEEKTMNLEALIKARILEGNYDDVIRKRAIDPKAFLPSRLLELQDTQSTKSLTSIYEDEYNKTKDQSTDEGKKVTNIKDEKLIKEHNELKLMFESLSGKLDGLSNSHFTPNQPNPTIKTINNLASISIESSLPTSTGSGTLLAPEEIYNVKSTKDLIVDVDALTHTQKQNLRTHNKQSRSKQFSTSSFTTKKIGPSDSKSGEKVNSNSNSTVKEQKLNSLELLKKPSNTLSQNITILGNNKRSIDSDLKGSSTTFKNKNRKLASGASFKL